MRRAESITWFWGDGLLLVSAGVGTSLAPTPKRQQTKSIPKLLKTTTQTRPHALRLSFQDWWRNPVFSSISLLLVFFDRLFGCRRACLHVKKMHVCMYLHICMKYSVHMCRCVTRSIYIYISISIATCIVYVVIIIFIIIWQFLCSFVLLFAVNNLSENTLHESQLEHGKRTLPPPLGDSLQEHSWKPGHT